MRRNKLGDIKAKLLRHENMSMWDQPFKKALLKAQNRPAKVYTRVWNKQNFWIIFQGGAGINFCFWFYKLGDSEAKLLPVFCPVPTKQSSGYTESTWQKSEKSHGSRLYSVHWEEMWSTVWTSNVVLAELWLNHW